jgi:ribonuclease HI
MSAIAICDGRGNAGTGACAAVLKIDGTQIDERAKKIHPTTNIVAEHLSIQLAMELSLDNAVKRLLILNDSQTPVNQVLGIYKVKQAHLLPIVQKTWEMGQKFEKVEIKWVPREQTKEADLLCRRVDRPQAARPRPQVLASAPQPRKPVR